MENEMVERVADAIWPLTEWNGDRQEAVRAARAAIEAMREPTEAMIRASARACLVSSGDLDATCGRQHRAVIDAVLAPHKEPA